MFVLYFTRKSHYKCSSLLRAAYNSILSRLRSPDSGHWNEEEEKEESTVIRIFAAHHHRDHPPSTNPVGECHSPALASGKWKANTECYIAGENMCVRQTNEKF